MDARSIDTVCTQIYKRFPDIAGTRPKVQTQPDSPDGSKFLLIFKGSGTTADGKRIPRIVRVVANEQGKILKVTTSK